MGYGVFMVERNILRKKKAETKEREKEAQALQVNEMLIKVGRLQSE